MAGAFSAAAFDEYAFDVDYTSSSALFLSVAGVQRATDRIDTNGKVLHGSLTVVDILNETPNTCTFQAIGFAPLVGQRVLISLGGITNPSRLFAGTVLSVDQSYAGTPDNAVYQVRCADDTWKLGQVKVTTRYTNQSATDIATDLIDTYAPDFDSSTIEAALPTVDEITFTNEDLATCLTRLAKRIGGYWKPNEFEEIYFFTTNPDDNPTNLTDANPPLGAGQMFTVNRDISQMITRVTGEGGGSAALADVAVGETILPVQSVEYFNALGGQFVSGPQRCDYTGVAAGGGGGLVGPGAAPTSAPAAALASGSGVETGAHSYAVTYVTGAGESIAGPSVVATTGAIPKPSAAPTAGSPTVGSGVTTGTHYYAVTFVNAAGETDGSAVSATVSPGPITTGVLADPASAPTKTVSATTGNLIYGSRTHAVTFYNGAGETIASPTVASTVTQITDSGGWGVGTPTAGGSVDDGTHNYAYTYVSASGETGQINTGQATPGSGNNTVPLTLAGISDARATHIRVYRSAVGGGTLYRVATVAASASPQAYDDTASDASISGNPTIPGSDTASTGSIDLASIPTGPSGTTGRKIYRTVSSGAQLKLVATIANNTATTYSDNIADGSLGANVPTSNTTGTATDYNVVPLTAIPTGNATVTSRKLYRTAAGGSQLKLLATIANNTATTYSDTIADGSLGANIPVSNTATANQVSLTAIPIGGSGVTSRKVYRTVAAGSQLKLLTTVADNTTTTYTDSTADASLGANVPTSDTSGLSQPAGQVIPGATSIVMTGLDTMPTAGWAVIGNGAQVVRYTGKSSTALTGVPASGIGAVTASVAYNSTATSAPQLTGIPASSTGSILFAVTKGDPVNLFITENDNAAQAVLAAAIGSGDGIVEEHIQDRRLIETEIRARAVAVLELRALIDTAIGYQVRGDRNTKSGTTIDVDLTAFGVNDTFKIQKVTITNFQPALDPVYDVEASTSRFAFEDLLRIARGGAV